MEEWPVVVPVRGRGCRDDDTAAVGALDERLKLRMISLERLGDDLRILARPAATVRSAT